MSVAAPMSGQCAAHAGVKADWACQRCGSFVCLECERRTRPEAPPLCPKCWALREQTVQHQEVVESKKLQIAGLVLGVVSVLHPLLLVGSLVVNIRELRRRKEGANRWMNQVGLAGSAFAVFAWMVLIIVLVTR